MAEILVITSQYHQDLSQKQLDNCLEIIKKSDYDYQVEISRAGAYEIPFIINTFQKNRPYDAYIALGLVLKTSHDHYDYINSHIKYCFTHFALNNIPVGNAILAGDTMEELADRINSPNSCLSALQSAFNAVDYLIDLKSRYLKF